MRRLAFIGLWLVVFMLSFDNMLGIDETFSYARVLGIIVVVLSILGLCEGKPLRMPSLPLLAIVPYFVWCVMSLAWTPDSEHTITVLLRLVNLVFFVWAMWEFCRTKSEVHWMMRSYLLGHIVPFVMIFANRGAALGSSDDNEVIRLSGGGHDQNYLSELMVIGIIMAIYLMSLLPRKSILRWIYIGFVVLAVPAVLLTGSRAGFLGLIFAVLWTAFYISVPGRRILSLLILAIVCTVSLPLVALVVPQNTLNRVLGTQNYQGDELNNRLEIWTNGAKAFAKRPVQGLGFGCFYLSENGVDLGVRRVVAHNILVSIAVEVGFVGLLLYVTMLTLLVIALWRIPHHERVVCLGILIAWMFFSLSAGSGIDKLTWFVTAITIVSADTYAPALTQRTAAIGADRRMKGLARLIPRSN